VLVVFDVLELDGEDLRPLPLLDRRDAVHWFGSPVPGIQAIQYVETHGEALFGEIVRHDQGGESLPSCWMRPIAPGANRVG
jgi:ATP-dependent DNA ligase